MVPTMVNTEYKLDRGKARREVANSGRLKEMGEKIVTVDRVSE